MKAELLVNEMLISENQVGREVIWLNKKQESGKPYDILVDEKLNGATSDGEPPVVLRRFIEVKLVAPSRNNFIISMDELMFCEKNSGKTKENMRVIYEVFVVRANQEALEAQQSKVEYVVVDLKQHLRDKKHSPRIPYNSIHRQT